MSDTEYKKPRILIFTETFFPAQGGSERLAHNFACELARQGWRVTLYAPSMEGSAAFDQSAPYRVLRDDVWGKFRRIDRDARPTVSRASRAAAALYLFRALRRIKWDAMVAVHLPPIGIPAWMLRKTGRGPVCVWALGEELVTAMRSKPMRLQVELSLKTADSVFVISKETARTARDYGVEKRRMVLQFPTPDRSFFSPLCEDREALRARHGIASDELVITTISRLVERKGIDTVLRALGEIHRTRPAARWRYLIGGVGDYKPELRRIAEEEGIRDRVQFLGALPEEEKLETIEAADLFAMPNRQIANGELEGFGIVFVEAALRGTPSLGGRSGGTLDAVAPGESGWLVNPDTTEETRVLLEEFLENPAMLAERRTAAREWAVQKFDPHRRHEAVVRRLEKLIARSMGRSRHAPGR